MFDLPQLSGAKSNFSSEIQNSNGQRVPSVTLLPPVPGRELARAREVHGLPPRGGSVGDGIPVVEAVGFGGSGEVLFSQLRPVAMAC